MIRPVEIDGEQFFVAIASPLGARRIRKEQAAALASEKFAGRNWRRVKREMNKARKRAR